MARINLFFEKFEDEDYPGHIITRLKCGIQFKTHEGWTLPYSGIIDTGAHTSVLPLSVWQEILHETLRPYRIYGIVKKEDCALQGTLATANLILIDEKGNQSEEMKSVFFLANTDQTPIILGFRQLLDQAKIYFQNLQDEAFIEFQ